MTVHKHYMAKILIAEDNRVEAALIENMLEDFGCEVFKARGLDIVDKLDTPYDLIFLDINMPGISGFYIANNLKKSSSSPTCVPIILVSSEPYTEEIKEQCVESDVDGYVQKPMTQALLATILDEYIPEKETSLLATGKEESKLFLRKRHT
ncbi:response regulator [Marinagarivorans algicola]|uniref:response regulator n=1 Tax=Marinagarivorans algicola TaxID=1513270 RepID=UPI003735726B